jgi:hypothetical protein
VKAGHRSALYRTFGRRPSPNLVFAGIRMASYHYWKGPKLYKKSRCLLIHEQAWVVVHKSRTLPETRCLNYSTPRVAPKLLPLERNTHGSFHSKPSLGIECFPQPKYPLKLTSKLVEVIRMSISDQKLKKALEKLCSYTGAIKEDMAQGFAARISISTKRTQMSNSTKEMEYHQIIKSQRRMTRAYMCEMKPKELEKSCRS